MRKLNKLKSFLKEPAVLVGLFFFVLILVSGGVDAVNVCGNDNSFLGQFDLNQNITLKQSCDSCSFVNLSSVTYPNGTLQSFNIQMIKNGIDYLTYFSGTDTFGCYSYNVLGDKDGVNTAETVDFLVGNELTTGRAVSYGGFILILLFAFALTLFGAFKVRWQHTRNDEGKVISINNFRYIKVFLFCMAYLEVMFLFGLSYKFFNEANIEGFTEFFNFVYQLFLNLMYPIIVLTIIIFFVIWINNIKLKKKNELGL